jgi:hypothetical protein
MNPSMWTSTCDVYRPFGAASPTTSGIVCRLVPDMANGQQPGGLSWTHYVDLPADVDVRDGCGRSLGSLTINYADGDELRIPGGSDGARFVVVWVEHHNQGTSAAFNRAFLTRHEVAPSEATP